MLSNRKRDAALELVEACSHELATIKSGPPAIDLCDHVVSVALSLQGSDADRPYLARTICRISQVFRAWGWIDSARQALDRAIAAGLGDAYLFSQLTECFLAKGDCDAAVRVLRVARDAGCASDAIYTSLVKAYGRKGDVATAERVFVEAIGVGAASAYIYPALIAAYGVARDAAGARRSFQRARDARFLSSATYAALMNALLLCGDHAAVGPLWEEAVSSGHMSCRVVRTAIRAALSVGRIDVARAILNQAIETKRTDRMCFAYLIVACCRARRFRDVKRWMARARLQLTPDECRQLKQLSQRERRSSGRSQRAGVGDAVGARGLFPCTLARQPNFARDNRSTGGSLVAVVDNP